MTTVDVVLPVRNGAAHLAEAITSILDQDHRDLRLIIVDDGSTDESAAIAHGFAIRDDRVVVTSIPPTGLPGALNAGLELVTAPWLARMDADDLSVASRLSQQLQAAQRMPQVVGWATWARAMTVDGVPSTLMARGPRTVEEFAAAHAAGPLDVNGATVMLRSSVVREVGGWDPDFDYAEDVELYDRMGDVGPLLTVTQPLYLVRMHPGSHWLDGIERSLLAGRYLQARKTLEAGQRPDSLQTFVAAHRQQGRWRQVMWRRQVCARRWHQRATMAIMERRWLAAIGASGIVAVLAPWLLIRRASRLVARLVKAAR